MPAILTNVAYVPRTELNIELAENYFRQLTFLAQAKEGDVDVQPIYLYDNTDPDYYIFPRAWASTRFHCERQHSLGNAVVYPKRPDPNHPAVKEPERQAQFMRDLITATNQYHDFIAQADTGTGKTYCSLNTIAEFGRNALIIVPTEVLADQWKQSAIAALGLTEDQIGMVQGDKCDYIDKHIVIAIVNSLALRDDYPDDFYSYFGFTIIDECHRIGSQVFSRAAPKINSNWRIGLSATPKRKDGADLVIKSHLGEIRVVSQAVALYTEVHAIPYKSARKVTGRMHTSLIQSLTRDDRRNDLLVQIIKKLYDADRNILCVGDNILHLQHMMQKCVRAGIPFEVIGQFTGQRELPTGKRVKIKLDELQLTLKTARVLFATYNMIKEGVDEPRLDAGVDLTPRSDATQVVGRIRRSFPGKKVPVWYTLIDVVSKRLAGYYYNRERDYNSKNMRVIEYDVHY